MGMNLFAGGRFVRLEFEHERRIPHNVITIELASENNRERVFYARLITRDLGQNNPLSEKRISIEREYFDVMYDRILSLNFKEIIKNHENLVGAGGASISLTVGTGQNNIKISLRSPAALATERKTEEFHTIVYDLFSLFDMQEWR